MYVNVNNNNKYTVLLPRVCQQQHRTPPGGSEEQKKIFLNGHGTEIKNERQQVRAENVFAFIRSLFALIRRKHFFPLTDSVRFLNFST
jgi:hypothetical protein